MDSSQLLKEGLEALNDMSQREFAEYWTQNFGKGLPLADRMKGYEKQDSQQYRSNEIVVARIDGRGFSKLTKHLNKPFDAEFTDRMIETTKALVEETSATIGYTQSDEISLIWHTDNPNGQIFFNGKVQKLCSICASIATAAFNTKFDKLPIGGGLFDCRVFVVPSKDEGVNYMTYRQRDCIKNSIGMATSEKFSHREQMHKSTTDKLEMLEREGINWSTDYRTANRLGTFVQRVKYTTISRFNTQGPVCRNVVEALDINFQLDFNNLYKLVFGEKDETTT